MHTKWSITLAAAMLTAYLAAVPPEAASAAAAGSAAPVAAATTAGAGPELALPTYKKLTDNVQALLKSAYVERSAYSQTLGIVVWLRNDGGKVTRVPDYELRVTGGDGVTYTLTPSVANPRAIQPKGKVELSYLLNVTRTDDLKLAKLAWVEVDEYVYPRKETTLLSMDVAGKVWQSAALAGDNVGGTVKIGWGQPFKLELFAPDVVYVPASVEKQTTAQGDNVTIVTLRVTNTGKEQAFVPDFAISGSDGSKIYAGQRIELGRSGDAGRLGAGETKSVRYAIPSAASVRFTELVVTTPERFVTAAGEMAVHQVGHVRLGLPEKDASLAGLKNYEFDTPIALDSLNELVDKDVQVSLVELHMHDNQGDGYQTAIAKFKLRNTGKEPAALPAFGAELTDANGYTYAGVRQNVAAQSLMPGLSHVVSYSFNVPKTLESDRYALRLLEGGGTAEAPYSAPIARIGVQMQSEEEGSHEWNLYPFHVKMNYWSVSAVADMIPVTSYSYKMKLDLDIERTDDVVVDAGFSRLKIEIADSFGRMLGATEIPFVGANRLISGVQTIRFDNIRTEQHQYPLTINIYEVIDTPNGQATRLIETLQQ